MSNWTNDAILDALRGVVEPELGKDMVSLELGGGGRRGRGPRRGLDAEVKSSNPAMHARKRMQEAVEFALERAFGKPVACDVKVIPLKQGGTHARDPQGPARRAARHRRGFRQGRGGQEHGVVQPRGGAGPTGLQSRPRRRRHPRPERADHVRRGRGETPARGSGWQDQNRAHRAVRGQGPVHRVFRGPGPGDRVARPHGQPRAEPAVHRRQLGRPRFHDRGPASGHRRHPPVAGSADSAVRRRHCEHAARRGAWPTRGKGWACSAWKN